MTHGAPTIPALPLDPPDTGEALSCSCCGREVDGCIAEEIRCGVYACSKPCAETLTSVACPDCGANEMEGEEHSRECLEVQDADRDEDVEPDCWRYEWDGIEVAS